MDNNGQQLTTIDNNEQQWTTMDNNRQQWTTMDNNGQYKYPRCYMNLCSFFISNHLWMHIFSDRNKHWTWQWLKTPLASFHWWPVLLSEWHWKFDLDFNSDENLENQTSTCFVSWAPFRRQICVLFPWLRCTLQQMLDEDLHLDCFSRLQILYPRYLRKICCRCCYWG